MHRNVSVGWSGLLLALAWVAPAAAGTGPAAATSSYSPVVSFAHLPALQVATPVPGTSRIVGDMNGDGESDLLWFNPGTSQFAYWLMKSTPSTTNLSHVVTRIGSRMFNVTPGYFVAAVGDLDGDGYTDLVFTSARRDLWLWKNNRNGGFTSSYMGTYPAQWQLVGAGDVNGDNHDDLLWVDPGDCEFGQWMMSGSVRIGSAIQHIACGYYPMGIGYYGPGNRLSVLWTSAANDLYIWDARSTGWQSYKVAIDLGHVWAFGGGYMGQEIGEEGYLPDSSGQYTLAVGGDYYRSFDGQGRQTSIATGGGWDGGAVGTPESAGYFIEGNGINATGLYVFDPTYGTLAIAGLHQNSPTYPSYCKWQIPAGWYAIGAPANHTAQLPWQ